MSDLISRSMAIKAVYDMHVGGESAVKNALPNTYGEDIREIVDMLEELPSVTSVTVQLQGGYKYSLHGFDYSEEEDPNLDPCRGCDDYIQGGGCKSEGGCGTWGLR